MSVLLALAAGVVNGVMLQRIAERRPHLAVLIGVLEIVGYAALTGGAR